MTRPAQQHGDAKCKARDNGCGYQIVAIKRDGGSVAGCQTGHRARIHGAAGPYCIVGDEPEGCGAEDHARSNPQPACFRFKEDVTERHDCDGPRPGGEVRLPDEFVVIGEDGEEIIRGNKLGDGGEHLAPRASRAEVEESTADGGKVQPAVVRDHAGENCKNQQQISGHEHLWLRIPSSPQQSRHDAGAPAVSPVGDIIHS